MDPTKVNSEDSVAVIEKVTKPGVSSPTVNTVEFGHVDQSLESSNPIIQHMIDQIKSNPATGEIESHRHVMSEVHEHDSQSIPIPTEPAGYSGSKGYHDGHEHEGHLSNPAGSSEHTPHMMRPNTIETNTGGLPGMTGPNIGGVTGSWLSSNFLMDVEPRHSKIVNAIHRHCHSMTVKNHSSADVAFAYTEQFVTTMVKKLSAKLGASTAGGELGADLEKQALKIRSSLTRRPILEPGSQVEIAIKGIDNVWISIFIRIDNSWRMLESNLHLWGGQNYVVEEEDVKKRTWSANDIQQIKELMQFLNQ